MPSPPTTPNQPMNASAFEGFVRSHTSAQLARHTRITNVVLTDGTIDEPTGQYVVKEEIPDCTLVQVRDDGIVVLVPTVRFIPFSEICHFTGPTPIES